MIRSKIYLAHTYPGLILLDKNNSDSFEPDFSDH